MRLSPKPLSFCALIPCYNHGDSITNVLESLYGFEELSRIIIVDDGSAPFTRERLKQLAQDYPLIHLIHLPHNQGKGAAVQTGLQAAFQLGFTHALQVDADGQHTLNDVPTFLESAKQHPDQLISGYPQYDQSIPKSRRYGRYITHFWVWIETLSFALKDSMCGFRVYPLAQTEYLFKSVRLGQRMDFDIEIMVRLYWQGCSCQFIRTHVIYPEQGISHFHGLKDNLRISFMHTRLFFGMLYRFPSLIRKNRHHPQHWSTIKERQGKTGMRFMLWVYKTLGRKWFERLLWPVICLFWLSGKTQRTASRQWLNHLTQYAQQHTIPLPYSVNSLKHFHRFGVAMLDKIASWNDELRWGKDIDFAPGSSEILQVQNRSGKLILASHLGDIEVCRALAQNHQHITINALVFTDHAQHFSELIKKTTPKATLHLITVKNIGPELAIQLKEKIEAGEWVAIVGDRTAISPSQRQPRILWSPFLGRPAPFPEGPFILASLLQCPVYLMFALMENRQLRIYCESFANPLYLPRATRQEALQHWVNHYASRLEHYALKAPLDWFNFFDFWTLADHTPASRH